MVSRTVEHLLKEINSMLNETFQEITQKLGKINDENTADLTNQSLRLIADNNNTSIFTTQIKTDVYQVLSTTLITSESDNSTQSTMTRNIVSAFTINSADILDKPHHNIMVAILLGIFTCISLTITISIFVFCRKKNSVFMLQKCEQDSDIDLEMNDMNTEVETSDSEYEFIESTSPEHSRRRSQTCPNLSNYTDVEISHEDNRQMTFDKYCSSRRSLNRNKTNSTGSPTSTPLLNSTSPGTSELGPIQFSLNTGTRQFKQSLSMSFMDRTAEISGKKLNLRVRKQSKEKKLTTSRKDTKENNSKSSEATSFQQKTNTGKFKHLHTDSMQNPNSTAVRNSEYNLFEIKIKHSSGKTKKKHQFCVPNTLQKKVDSSILQMESMQDNSAEFSDDGLQGDTDEIREFNGKLEIL